MKKYLFRTALGLMGLMGTLAIGVVNAQEINKDIVLEATATEAGQTLKINKYFANAYTVDWGDGTTGNLTSDATHTYSIASGYAITLSLSGADRWTFRGSRGVPLVPKNGTTVTGVKIIYMPSLASGFGVNATSPGNYFFRHFNDGGAITSFPDGSFDTSKITTLGGGSFEWFNSSSLLTSLPDSSFDTSSITTVGDRAFYCFNANGALLTRLPEKSFDTSNITTVGNSFFYCFNDEGALESLPDGSFDISNITTAGHSFFGWFNLRGQLKSLPDNSFRLSTGLTTVGNSVFTMFNYEGQLTSLPEGSFDTSYITTAGGWFFWEFNRRGKLTNLPDSFTMNSIGASGTSGYENAFNSSNYTLNRNVSDLVAGITVPSTDMNTFSNNQPGRCGVHENWLVSKANACRIVYDANGGTGTTTGGYNSDITGVVAGSGIKAPTRARYTLSGWLDASGNKVEEVIFPDMDGQTLYANWEELNCSDGYILDSTETSCVLKEYVITYNLGGGYLEDGEGNKYEGNQIVTYTYNTGTNKYDSNLNLESIKRENSKFLGRYTSEGEVFDFGTIPPENHAAYAKFECNFGCVENTEKTACEKIRVDFDANGGKFSDNTNIYSIIKSKQVLGEKTSVLHTANLDDNGNYTNEFGGQLMNGYNTSLYPYTSGGITTYPISSPSIMYIQEDDAQKFNVSIKYGGSPYCTPGHIIVWTGDHRQFDGNYNPTNTGLAVLYIGNFPNFGENSEKSVEIEGDSFTIYQNGGCPSYGFFANIFWTGVVDLIYEENDFDNIPQPKREGYSFKGWYLADGSEFNAGNVSTGEVTKLYAKWEKIGSSGGGGGAGGSSSKNENTENNPSVTDVTAPLESGAQGDESDGSPISRGDTASAERGSTQQFTAEFQQAYEFAKGHGITTMPTIQKADMEGKLTRIAMAKMLSQYAMNILGQKSENIVVPKFNDVTDKQNADYDDGVTLAYQLGIMGQNMPNNNFRPNDEVSRAEFATALSRMIYGTSDGEYKGTGKYYVHHMEKLVKEGIITKDDPNMKELRGYVMIMLMRSAK